jgi:ATP-dependent Clp protease ATP-binding subunit ClpB
MAMIVSRSRGAIVALLVTVAFALDVSMGFVPPSPPTTSTLTTSLQRAFVSPIACSNSFVTKARRPTPATSLRMAGGDFDESKYTEAAWSAVATLTKAAEYYEASTVEAPILLDIMLNPSKHNAGDDAESAKRVVEKVFQKANVDLNSLRSELEKYLAKQPKVSGTAQKTLGRNLQKVLEYARDTKNVLGVSGLCVM